MDQKLKPFNFEDLPTQDDQHEEPLIGPPSKALDRDSTIRMIGETSTDDDLRNFLAGYLNDTVFAERFTACMSMLRQKNADYSQGEQKGDRIAAFRRIGRDINITMPQAWAVFCQKHWGAVMKYVKDGIVESESIHGRINDIINYMALFGAIVDEIENTKASDDNAAKS